jgi:trehalose 6-phosphate phosphatase
MMKKTDDPTLVSTGGRRIWVFDFDGTLSQLVRERGSAVLHPESRRLLVDLKADPSHVVAILSSRSLDDLCTKVDVEGIYLGGGSGTEWRTPEQFRVSLGARAERRLALSREKFLAALRELSSLPGVDLEDKNWSAALHLRKADPVHKRQLLERIEVLHRSQGLSYTTGHEVVEVQFLSEVNKAFGVRLLCRFLRFDASRDFIFYAGDDENDAIAMQWVIGFGGTSVTVGERPFIPGTLAVPDQVSLVKAVRNVAHLDDRLGCPTGTVKLTTDPCSYT